MSKIYNWFSPVNQILYTPTHWLAYNNDHMAMLYLMKRMIKDEDSLFEFFRTEAKDITPIGFAG